MENTFKAEDNKQEKSEYEIKKEELAKKHQEELDSYIDSKFQKILESYYGPKKTQEERDKEWQEKFQGYYKLALEKEAKKEIAGRTYTSKEINKFKVRKFLLIAALILLQAKIMHYSWDQELLGAYKTIRADQTSDFTPEEKEMLDDVNYKDLPRIKEAIKNNETKYAYTLGGDRVDGTHNEYYVFDKGALIQANDIELDPIERLVKEDIKGIKQEKESVTELKPKAEGNVGIKEGFGEPIGSGRTR